MSEASIKNVVIYTRVSSVEQVDGYSLDLQREDLMRYIDYKRFNLIGEFKDEGISAKDVENRPGFQNMMSFVKSKASSDDKVDAIIVWKLSRLSRNTLDLLQTLEDLEKYNCYLISEKDSLNTIDTMGSTIIKLLGVFAELERVNIANNVRSNMYKATKSGAWVGGKAPYGYDNVPKTLNKPSTLSINEGEATIVRLIFNYYAEGFGYAKIARILNNEMQIKTKLGNNWTFTSIQQMLDNPVYIGKVRYGVHAEWDKKGRAGKVDDKDVQITEGLHEAIIDKDTWDRVRFLRAKKGFKQPKTRESTHLLSGKILCPVCKTAMVMSITSKKRKDGSYNHNYYYKCGNNNNTKTCKSNLVKKETIDEQVKELLFEIVKSPKLVDTLTNKLNQTVDIDYHKKAISKANRGIKILQGEIETGFNNLFKHNSDDDTISTRLKKGIQEREVKIKTLEEEILKHKAQVSIAENKIRTAKDIAKLLLNFKVVFEKSSLERQRELINYLVKSIEVHNDTDINKRSQLKEVTLQFNEEEFAKLELSDDKKVCFTYDTHAHK